MPISEHDHALLVRTLLDRYAYDFTRYAPSSMRRRIRRIIDMDGHQDVPGLLAHLERHPAYLNDVVSALTVTVTEMFRDPAFFHALRNEVIPVLATYPFIRIWCAGCATGEEPYSLAILLHEAGLLDKTLIYATDINGAALRQARRGTVSLAQMRDYTKSYLAAGGREDFSQYYDAGNQEASFVPALRKPIVFASHNLVSDWAFNSFQLVLCRNVLIYFNKDLQNRILSMFDASLEPLGFLALGSKETLMFSDLQPKYQQQDGQKIWRRKY